MSEMTTDQAVDSVQLICDSAVDCQNFTKTLRRAKKNGVSVDREKATAILADILRDLVEECAAVSQGDDADREELCVNVARALMEKYS